MDVRVELEDEVLRRLRVSAKRKKQSLNQELLDILNRAAKAEQLRKRKKRSHD